MKKQIEIKNRRGLREKHFLNKDGTIEAIIYQDEVHFFKNGKYEEIDNTLVKMGKRFCNRSNSFHVEFSERGDDQLLKIEKDKQFLKIWLEGTKNNISDKYIYSMFDMIDDKKHVVDEINYYNMFDNIDLNYQVLPNKVKENIIITDVSSIKDQFIFNYDTNLGLKIKNDRSITVTKDNKFYFKIEAPYMIDNNGVYNDNIYYELKDNQIILNLDRKWLENCSYPVIIDPTITTRSSDGLQDTFISSKYPNTNFNDRDYLLAGVFDDEIGRTLVKFDLPKIGTGSSVIEAKLYLTGYPTVYNELVWYDSNLVNAHIITQDWSESIATWNNMHDKYDQLIEDYNRYHFSILKYDNSFNPIYNFYTITGAVKKWYSGMNNYGIMLKSNKEIYVEESYEGKFFSKNNNVQGHNPKPFLTVTYRNQNGLESYMTYHEQGLSSGMIYTNHYNGNLTTTFNLGNTVGGVIPASLNLFYNTNDVILENNYGFGIGMKINFYQTIKSIYIEEELMYEYVDEDGTIHYFRRDLENEEDLKYYDEDGLALALEVFTDNCVIKDKDKNKMLFIKNGELYYLKEIENTKGDKVIITYENNQIIKITDASLNEINITYGDTIIITSDRTVTLNFNQNNLISIADRNGIITIDYNNKNIISDISDINGLKKSFEYYDTIPYRIKKISEYSINNYLGRSWEFNYGFQVTTITDNKNKVLTYSFNDLGNTVSITDLKQNEDLNNGFGNTYAYAHYYNLKNKYTGKDNLIKHINNLIYNSSFEKNNLFFSSNDGLNISFSEDEKNTGNRSLKFSGLGSAFIEKQIKPNTDYTFSVYAKNDIPFKLVLETNNEMKEIEITSSEEFIRNDITVYNSNNDNLKISFVLSEVGIVYIDDIQLEEGKIANLYNLIDNSNFELGMAGWEKNHEEDYEIGELIVDNNLDEPDEIITLNSGIKAYKMVCDPSIVRSLCKKINFCGKAGDRYYVTFWYKNEGVPIPSDRNMYKSNQVYGRFFCPDDGGDVMFEVVLNPSSEEWQFCSTYIGADYDYEDFELLITSTQNANYLYIANVTMVKDLYSGFLSYDNNGNVSKIYDDSSNMTEFKYDKNNQLIQMTNPQGTNFNYEYDNDITNRILKGISPTGITNQIKYDNFGNPIVTRIENKTESNINNGTYYIRQKGTNKYLKVNTVTKKLYLKNDTCSHDKFKIEVNNDTLSISPILNQNVYTNNFTLLNEMDFTFIKQDNSSYLLKNNNQYLTITDLGLELKEEEDLNNQQFYFEKQNKLFIENTAEYTLDGKFLISTTDTLFNKTSYDINTDKGLVNSITDSLDNVTFYNYNNKDQLMNINKDNMLVNYEYNNNLLSKIILGNKEYIFNYDEFLNTSSIYINNIKLIENNYENNNGNLLSSVYGNNDTISYEYDEFDRVTKINKMNDTINYYYDNLANLRRIETNNNTYIYNYDLANRLIEYKQDEFILKYNYNNLNNIISKKQKLNDLEYVYNFEYNEEEAVSKITNDDVLMEYTYDELGRLINKNNNGYITNYNYVTNGNRTSTLINGYTDNFNDYKYKYDRLGNITKIYKNDILVNQYYYDSYNQLIKEENEINIVEYNYDNYGNILNKKIYDLENNLLNENIYEYSNNNWKDQLTKYNNEIITYDAIGNPLTIGDKVLTWINGRQLNGYSDLDNNITYKYNKDGIRIEKNVNGLITRYYLENNKIIFCEKDQDMLYFMYDNNSLIGFKYNEDTYYYIKNIQEDIIGIMDEDLEQIVTYEYDSWGSIISIKDNNGNDISNNPSHIGNINPFRYRSYYYDVETGIYYLNSRYYNPTWGRFINSDQVLQGNKDILGYNLYTYVSNNPTTFSDPTGQLKWPSWNDIVNVAKTIYNAIKNPATKPVANTTSKIAKDIVKNELGKAITIEYSIGSGYGLGANFSGVGIEAKDITLKSTTTINPFPTWQETYNMTSEGSFKVAGTGFTRVTDAQGSSWQFNVGNVDISNKTIFIGAEIEAYIGVGGNFKVGLEFDKTNLFYQCYKALLKR